LPVEAAMLRSAVMKSAADVPIAILQQVIEQVRVHEGSQSAERRSGWTSARAATHLALAQRGSRLALYDLRETIESAREPLPVEFFAALTEIGDTTCLEPIAAAYTRATDDWSRRQLVDAIRAIVKREKVSRRHAAVKKIEKRWPGAWETLVVSR
jgi:HEAT repeat protein